MSEHTMEQWGKDHWSLLAYVECCAVEKRGILARSKMRCNESQRPLLHSRRVCSTWESKYSTRLKDGNTIEGHDDWDCLEDLESAGFLEIISLSNPRVSLTDKGFEAAAALRKHKGGGGTFNSFKWDK